MSKLDLLYKVIKEAKDKEKELIKGYSILRLIMSSKDGNNRLVIVLQDNYNKRTDLVRLYIREEYDLFFIDSTLDDKRVIEVTHIPIDELALGFKAVEEELEKVIEKEDEIKEVFRHQLGIL